MALLMTCSIEALHALTLDERRILQVLSVVYEPINQTTLQAILRRLAWRDQEGQFLSVQVAKPLRERLLDAGVLERARQGLICAPSLVEILTRETVREGTFETIRAAGETEVSSRPRNSWETPDAYRVTRRLRNALYSGSEPEVRRLLGLEGRGADQPVSYPEVQELAKLCLRSPDVDWLAGLPPSLQILVFVPKLLDETYALALDPDFDALAVSILTPLSQEHVEAALALAERHLLCGEFAQAGSILSDRVVPQALPLIGWLHFVQGRQDEALGVFDLYLSTLKRQTRKRNLHVRGLPGIFYLLALLRRGAPGDIDTVKRQTEIAERSQVPDTFGSVFRILDSLADVLGGRVRFQDTIWLTRDLQRLGSIDVFFQALARHWLGECPREEALDVLAGYCRAAIKAGVHWYAWEYADLMAALDCKPQLDGLLPRPAGMSALAGLISPKSTWEIALDALKGLGAGGGSKSGAKGDTQNASDRRMCWVLNRYGCRASLEPREQKRTKRGGWTQGRPVALQRLAESQKEFDYLTEEDRRILSGMTKDREEGWYSYGRIYYSLDSDRSLLGAVGHPRLFRPGVMDKPIELVAAGPALEVLERERDLLLRIAPFPPEGSNLLLQDEAGQRLRLIQFDASHRRIGEILGADGLAVPHAGKEKVLEGIAAIAPLLTVHSAIGGTEHLSETQEVDCLPRVHLNPLDEGLMLELFMHPLGDAGPRMAPGQGMATLFAEIDGRSVQTTRDLVAERGAAKTVLDACPILAGHSGWTWTLEDPEEALTALEQLHALGDAVALRWPEGKRIGLTSELSPSSMRVAVTKQRDWLGLEGELDFDDGRVLNMQQLLDLIQESPGRFVRLGEREFMVLSDALRRRLENLAGLTDKDGRFHPLAAGVIDENLDGMSVKKNAHWQTTLKRLAEVRDLEPSLPSTLQAELRDYQVEGFRWLARLAHWGAGACLADDMGLGKTLQALALVLSRATEGPTLVLAPMSVCSNWIVEASRFAPTLNPKRFGDGDREQMLESAGPFDLIVCSYGLVQTEGERLAGVRWATIVADEAQAFKNAMTKRSQAIMKLDAGFRLITTGTPIENHLGELWNLFRFINPGLLGSLETFNRRFANPIEQHQDSGARQRLRQLLRPFILRRLKSEVLTELPPRTEIAIELELGQAEAALYEAVRREAIERLETDETNPGQKRMQLLAEIMRLRRICCHPKLVLPDSELSSAKLDAFGEILDDLLDNRHKALVFSQFVDHLSIIRAYLDARGIRYQYLDGSTPEKKRKAAVTAFQAGEGDLFLISLRAGGSGLNLTAADYVIHMDPWWNPAVEDQASDRAHRIGQERPVTIYRLVTKGTIEEKILALHASKRDLADGLLEGTGDGGRLSYDEMLSLIRDQAL